MNLRIGFLFALWVALTATSCAAVDVYRPAQLTPPPIAREFRGAWITCVATNADWPSKPGIPVAEQKKELIALLDRAVELHLNAIIFQVRPACDAMYNSSIDPWSEYLTGTQGRAPEPYYDPLAFAIEEAHKRGLELHAWFNPFRAWHIWDKSPAAANHITKTHPEWIRHYADQVWLDPGEPGVRQYVLRVVADVVKRYDVDGVQFDDYFYPYPDKDAGQFSDWATWRRNGSWLPRDDWRRNNVNQFISSVYQSVKAAKPWVKFGISPFGIWRPGYPQQVKGLDAYATLYADSRLWLMSGWVDYLAPQLYWPVNSPQQSFPVLLNWWTQQNIKGRGIWPGLSAASVGEKFSAEEMGRQIAATRVQPGASGEIFFHLKNVSENVDLRRVVADGNREFALVPAIPWSNGAVPATPKLSVAGDPRSTIAVNWQTDTNDLRCWILQYHGTNNIWTTKTYFPSETGCVFSEGVPDIIALSAVNRFGMMSQPAVVRRTTPPARSGKTLMYLRTDQ